MTWEGWHWVADTKKLRDGKRLVVGKTYRLRKGVEPLLCEVGYHASEKPLDALQYALGSIICRVALSGKIVTDRDKSVATERTVLWTADATRTLHDFAVWCAVRALRQIERSGGTVDPRSWAAIEAKRGWLAGEVSDGELAAAGDAARAAQNRKLTKMLRALEPKP